MATCRLCITLTSTEDATTHRTLALIWQFERWGVPLWCFAYNKANSQYDLGEDGRPTNAPAEEAHQRHLDYLRRAGAIEYQEVFSIVGHSQTDWPCLTAEPSPLPTGEAQNRLERAILSFIDLGSPRHVRFAEFSDVVTKILGKDVWRDLQHDAKLHPAVSTSGQTRAWNRVWDGVGEGDHVGLVLSAYEIPPPWYSPLSHPVSMYGEGKVKYGTTGQSHTSIKPVPSGAWHVLTLAQHAKYIIWA